MCKADPKIALFQRNWTCGQYSILTLICVRVFFFKCRLIMLHNKYISDDRTVLELKQRAYGVDMFTGLQCLQVDNFQKVFFLCQRI